MTRATSILLVASTGLCTCLVSGSARAGNGGHLRTPVDWSGAACMTIIDRSGDGPIHALEYGVPYEDTELTQDEVVDSRTHQFFAFCRDRYLEDLLPGWITEANVMAAAQNGLGDADTVDFELAVLENSPVWAGCWSRVNGDDERRPITFEAAAEPVPWDTTMLPAGTYVVDGYTYEPWFNLWTAHPGVFKIIDDPDPAASGPAGALTIGEQTVTYAVDEASITGCVDAMDGSTMAFAWANGNINGDPDWQVFSEGVPVVNGMFEQAFAPPLETVSNSVMIRLEVEDPMGRTWTAYSREYLAVIEDIGGESGGCEGPFGDPCEDTDTDTGPETDSESSDSGDDAATTTDGPSNTDSGGTGCGCTSATPNGLGGLGGLALLALLGARRRRAR